MEASGTVAPYKRGGDISRWHVRFPGTGPKDHVASVGKEERHLADSLLAILRSLAPARTDNKELPDLCKAKLKELNA